MDRDDTPGQFLLTGSANLRRVPTVSFWHYRDAEREVDVIVERPSGEVLGVEVKAGATVRPHDFRGLEHMRDRIGSRLVAGVVLYTGERTLPFGRRLWAVPLSALWTPERSESRSMSPL